MRPQKQENEIYSVEEYIMMEETAPYKNEYRDGRIVAMAGGTVPHNSIGGNIYAALKNRLRGKTCKPHNSDQAIAVEEGKRYVYPDVSVVCGKDERSKIHPNAISNPILIVEVLSEGTSDYDRGEKFRSYISIESFKEYVLVSQKRIWVEVLTKIDESEWRFRIFKNPSETISLLSIDIELTVEEIYEDIVFEKSKSNYPVYY